MHSSAQESSSDDQSSRYAILSRLMEPAARDRLTRIALVHSDRARDVENILLRKAQEGLLQQKVSESYLISLLNQLKDEKTEPKIIFNRQAFDEE
ncbi:hypothetical protein T552_00824 [Pneumocystis carinii B80]|uniref:Programmed cell death protein 5 n=1 Tax=Pneumocystis carinii (strain B80) TaxID=1408658 RepID=A0A0W4ZPR7_PNEC8|nr:hypothetical protein T552_00824 [Pneumocystis carinii B80]KTW30351.1 hypothetical protein T552_00824 [Pneumocystis carinii B80]